MHYFFISAAILIAASYILIKKILKAKKGGNKKSSKEIQKEIEELRAIITNNDKDYVSIYRLAQLEDEIGENNLALQRYEILIKTKFLKTKEKISICKRLEEYYNEAGRKEDSLKYSIKLHQLSPNDNEHTMKLAYEITKEANYPLACHYFTKVILLKEDFDIEHLKAAAFAFFQVKDYNKCIAFLEELYKRLNTDKNAKEYKSEIDDIQKSLISLYILCESLNIANNFIEKIIIKQKSKKYINKLYLFVLYKLADNKKFLEVYNDLYNFYNIKDYDKSNYSLILDYCFYSYFIKDINFSKKSFEMIDKFNIEELKKYNIKNILEYLSEIVQATSQIKKSITETKLDNYKNDNYEKYVPKENIKNWEYAVDLWESSFIDTNYLYTLVDAKQTVNIDNILKELKINLDNIYDKSESTLHLKVDKIYDLNKADFKKVCTNIMHIKLDHSIVQEYTDKSNDNNKLGDEINFLSYSVKSPKKELTLVSFKRWQKIEVGELMIRDFLIMIEESGAENGILIIPVELSNSAKSLVQHNEKIKVYSRMQFNTMLSDENI